MGTSDVQAVIAEVDLLLNEEELTDRIELAIEKLLNVVEALSADKKARLGPEPTRRARPLSVWPRRMETQSPNSSTSFWFQVSIDQPSGMTARTLRPPPPFDSRGLADAHTGCSVLRPAARLSFGIRKASFSIRKLNACC